MAQYVLAITKDLKKLSVRAEEINVLYKNKEATKIINDLKDTLRANKDLVALAAPQLGHRVRMFCIKFANGDIRAFVNPMITKHEGLHLTRERCASIPDKDFIVPRPDRIIAVYQTPVGRAEENVFEGVAAEIFQQMVNLLDGVLLTDIGLEVTEEFDKASPEEQKEVLDYYLDTLKKRAEALNEEIESDEDLKETKRAIDFMAGVASGEITLEKQYKNPEETESN